MFVAKIIKSKDACDIVKPTLEIEFSGEETINHLPLEHNI